MSDWTDSLRSDEDDEVKTFVLELFDSVDSLHGKAETEIEQAYHQGEKDALRRVLTIITGRDCDSIAAGSVINYKLRGVIPLESGEFIKRSQS